MAATECKYCKSAATTSDPLITPCNCTDPVHKSCIEKWIQLKKNGKCEICLTEFYYTTVQTNIFRKFMLLRIMDLLFICIGVFLIVGCLYSSMISPRVFGVGMFSMFIINAVFSSIFWLTCFMYTIHVFNNLKLKAIFYTFGLMYISASQIIGIITAYVIAGTIQFNIMTFMWGTFFLNSGLVIGLLLALCLKRNYQAIMQTELQIASHPRPQVEASQTVEMPQAESNAEIQDGPIVEP